MADLQTQLLKQYDQIAELEAMLAKCECNDKISEIESRTEDDGAREQLLDICRTEYRNRLNEIEADREKNKKRIRLMVDPRSGCSWAQQQVEESSPHLE